MPAFFRSATDFFRIFLASANFMDSPSQCEYCVQMQYNEQWGELPGAAVASKD
jgi:hypothetical protein